MAVNRTSGVPYSGHASSAVHTRIWGYSPYASLFLNKSCLFIFLYESPFAASFSFHMAILFSLLHSWTSEVSETGYTEVMGPLPATYCFYVSCPVTTKLIFPKYCLVCSSPALKLSMAPHHLKNKLQTLYG